MPTFSLPAGAIPADLLQRVRLQIVTGSAQPPEGEGWLHEVKHDGHRLSATIAGDGLRLISRNGQPQAAIPPAVRTAPHRRPARAVVLDGEIAVPDERGVPISTG
jgi:bifunctional non-homologous end joining protein LigD